MRLFELISFLGGQSWEDIFLHQNILVFEHSLRSCGSWHGDNGSSNSFATIRLLFIVDRRRKSGCVEHVKQANSRLKISQLKTSVEMLIFLFEIGNCFRLNWWVFYEWRHEEYQPVKVNILIQSHVIHWVIQYDVTQFWHQLPHRHTFYYLKTLVTL